MAEKVRINFVRPADLGPDLMPNIADGLGKAFKANGLDVAKSGEPSAFTLDVTGDFTAKRINGTDARVLHGSISAQLRDAKGDAVGDKLTAVGQEPLAANDKRDQMVAKAQGMVPGLTKDIADKGAGLMSKEQAKQFCVDQLSPKQMEGLKSLLGGAKDFDGGAVSAAQTGQVCVSIKGPTR